MIQFAKLPTKFCKITMQVKWRRSYLKHLQQVSCIRLQRLHFLITVRKLIHTQQFGNNPTLRQPEVASMCALHEHAAIVMNVHVNYQTKNLAPMGAQMHELGPRRLWDQWCASWQRGRSWLFFFTHS